jgi:hypothetical protein
MLTSIFNFSDHQDTLGLLWCSLVHRAPMWPIHGHYQCRRCGRLHRVEWADAKPSRRVNRIPEFGPGSLTPQAND